ncbi:DnaD domain-containing protein [Clostridium psychrophilum]|uniref:DnaD domain-containing protein n=1 Tax=Clostridium psychrophilum TaxID=132926 RepID=UPI001C0E52A5|nr:DnaD domain protein [Clostridium psychrophilum]MBU3180706.1 DnaD domain protein [Clostridium psychrophilum]
MAKYRQLYTEFWSDGFILELNSEEKFFYLYLLTNTKSKQCGIYELPKKIIEIETGLSRETVDKLIKKFCEYKKILYCESTREIMILNWMKYNAPKKNSNIIICIHNELLKIKNREFIEILYEKYKAAQLDVDKLFGNLIIDEDNDSSLVKKNLENDVEKIEEITESSELSIDKPLTRGLEDPYNPVASNRIRSKKEELTRNKEKLKSKEEAVIEILNHDNNSTAANGISNIIKIFEENVHAITPLIYDKILEFTTIVSNNVIIMAIQEAVNYNAKTIKYISKILNNWISKGIKTTEQVVHYQKQWTIKTSSNQVGDQARNIKNSSFCDYDQRDYDFDALEKQLLGIA